MDGLNRLFTFGCSYTGCWFATWADLIGPNFKEYYNFGRGGACNTYIMNKFIEVDKLLNLNEQDYVIVMFTGISRFSFFNKDGWVCNGNVYHPGIDKGFVDNMWSIDWGVYNTWIAANTIKTILDLKKVKYKFLSSLDNSIVYSSFYEEIKEPTKKCYEEFINLLYDKESMDTWKNERYIWPKGYYRFEHQQYEDGHPTQLMHYEFLKEKLPEFNTDITKNTFELAEKSLNFRDHGTQAESFYKNLGKPYNKALNYTLF
jgi:hypothetical protein